MSKKESWGCNMCFVLDINCYHIIFNSGHADHDDLKPVLDWLSARNVGTCLVYGGRKYREELGKMGKYIPLLFEYKKVGKLVEIDDEMVNEYERLLESGNYPAAFDDKHIAAIFEVSGCRIFVTHDDKSDRFIKDATIYKNGRPPSIYKHRNHRGLLCNNNIVKLRNVNLA